MTSSLRCTVAAIALSLLATGVQAQSKYPNRPVRLLTPFAAGGGSDLLARLIAPTMTEVLGQTVIVDNRPGGGGTLGAGIAARAEPDGYTLIVVSGSYGANGALHDLPYDTVTGITPIILIGTTPLVLTVNPKVPVKSVREFIDCLHLHPVQGQRPGHDCDARRRSHRQHDYPRDEHPAREVRTAAGGRGNDRQALARLAGGSFDQ
jgi:tripartite-type tricarboxylate transporter receptor subunit TctC